MIATIDRQDLCPVAVKVSCNGELAVMEVDFYRADALAAIESDAALGALALRAAAAAMQLDPSRRCSTHHSSLMSRWCEPGTPCRTLRWAQPRFRRG